MKSFRIIIAIILLSLLALACVSTIPTQNGTATPTLTVMQLQLSNMTNDTLKTETPAVEYIYTTVSAVEAVRVRVGPGEEYQQVQDLYKYHGEKVQIFSCVNSNDGGVWAEIGENRFVNARYLFNACLSPVNVEERR